MKRSSEKHYAFIEGELSKNEVRFLEEHNIVRLDCPISALLNPANKKNLRSKDKMNVM
jgi:hypothetical protein